MTASCDRTHAQGPHRLTTGVLRLFICLAWGACLAMAASPVASWSAPVPEASPAPAPSSAPLEVNPYGPTVTNPATLTNVGVPEYEVFFFRQGSSRSQLSQVQTPVLVKYTWAPQWQLSLQTSGYTQIKPASDSPTSTALGDPGLTVKYLYLPPSKNASAQALQLTLSPSVSPASLGVSTGHAAGTLTWLYSRSLGESVTTDANLWATYLGDSSGTWRVQFCQSADVNLDLHHNLGLTADIHHFGAAGPQFPELWGTQVFVNWKASPALVFSAGVDLGLNRNTPRCTYIAGLVFLVGGRHSPEGTSARP